MWTNVLRARKGMRYCSTAVLRPLLWGQSYREIVVEHVFRFCTCFLGDKTVGILSGAELFNVFEYDTVCFTAPSFCANIS